MFWFWNKGQASAIVAAKTVLCPAWVTMTLLGAQAVQQIPIHPMLSLHP